MEIERVKGGSGPGGYERFYINHQTGHFERSNSRGVMKTMQIIMLGVVGHREYWPPSQGDDGDTEAFGSYHTRGLAVDRAILRKQGPYCKSPNGITGYPRPHFPWAEFANQGGPGMHGDGPVLKKESLDCISCPFASWHDQHPQCLGRYRIPFIFDPGDRNIKVLDLTQSGITQAKKFLVPILETGANIQEHPVKIILKSRVSDKVDFCVPKFFECTDPEMYGADPLALQKMWGESYQALTRGEGPPSTGGRGLTGLQMGS